MSLILEALRKSEAERQVGRAPGLMTPMALPAPRSGSRGWMLAALVLLAVVAIAAWFARELLPPAPERVALPQVVAPDPRLPARTAATETPASPVAADDSTATAAPDHSAPSATTTPAPSASTDAAGPEPIATPAPVAAPAPAPRDTPAAAAPPVTATPGTAAPAPAAEPLATATAPPPQPLTPPNLAPPTAPSAETPPLDALPGLHTIEEPRRSQLPPLRMSMHVFAEAVESRFVLIDGRRYGEGQSIVPGLVVDEIRRDGVVLAIDGRRVLLAPR